MRKDFLIFGISSIIFIALISIYFFSETQNTTPIKTYNIINPEINNSIITNTINKTITNTINTTNTTNTIKTNKTIPTTPVCSQSKNRTEKILNGNFSTGTYYGWNETNPGFGSAPLNIIFLNEKTDYYGIPWNNYGNNTFMATTFEEGVSTSPGNLTSLPFLNREPFLNFKMIGPQNGDIYIEILRNNTPVERAFFNTYGASNGGQSTFENETIPIVMYLCQNISIEIVFDSVGMTETKYIAVTGFYLSNTPTLTNGTLINYQILNQ